MSPNSERQVKQEQEQEQEQENKKGSGRRAVVAKRSVFSSDENYQQWAEKHSVPADSPDVTLAPEDGGNRGTGRGTPKILLKGEKI